MPAGIAQRTGMKVPNDRYELFATSDDLRDGRWGHPQRPGMEVHIGMRIDFANGHAFAKGIAWACRAVDDGK